MWRWATRHALSGVEVKSLDPDLSGLSPERRYENSSLCWQSVVNIFGKQALDEILELRVDPGMDLCFFAGSIRGDRKFDGMGRISCATHHGWSSRCDSSAEERLF